MEPVSLTATLVLGSIVYKFVDLLKYVSDWARGNQNQGQNGTITQLAGWLAGIAGVFAFSATDWADEVAVGDETLATVDGMSLAVLGVGATSLLSVVYDFKSAVDDTDSARKPKLL